MKFISKKTNVALVIFSLILTACSSNNNAPNYKITKSKIYQTKQTGAISPSSTVANLEKQRKAWKGTPYRLGGSSKKGVDCSAFTQITYRDLFGIDIPRTTTEQSKKGKKVARSELQAGDLVFFKTGRGPNGKHVGVYVKDGQFLHASTKGGVIYSSLNSPYWNKVYWQARRL